MGSRVPLVLERIRQEAGVLHRDHHPYSPAPDVSVYLNAARFEYAWLRGGGPQ
jgi:hypothetical protein